MASAFLNSALSDGRARQVPNGCIEWTRSKDTQGYGHTRYDGRTMRIHRIVYYETAGIELPKHGGIKLVVMHSCDNRACCNPDHLSLGTRSDNTQDCETKGRGNHPAGTENGRAVLTDGHIVAIRASRYGKIILSRMYGVSPAQIQRIRAGKQWRAAA